MKCTIEKIGEIWEKEKKISSYYNVRCEDGSVIPFEHTTDNLEEIAPIVVEIIKNLRPRPKIEKEIEV